MDLLKETLDTFNKRAKLYAKQTQWVLADECIQPFVRRVFGSGLAFDACAGTGAISQALSNNGWKVLSCDLNKEMLRQGNIDFPIICDIHSIPTIEKHYDLVVCRQGLQYTDLAIALGELSRICKGKMIIGHITIEENDRSDFWNKYFKIASPGRKHIFMPGEISSECRKIGLNIVSEHVFHQTDYYLGPILHLPKDKIKALTDLLLSQSNEFKSLYGVNDTSEGDIIYSNRWEIIEIDI